MTRNRSARCYVAFPPPGTWEHDVVDEFLNGPREPRPRRAVPRQLGGLYFQEPEGVPTAASKRAALDEAARKLDFDRAALLAYCASQDDIRSAAFFGSVLREDFLDTSDVDLLLDCEDWSRLKGYRKAFGAIFGRKADLTTYESLHNRRNPIGRRIAWNSKRTFYEKGR